MGINLKTYFLYQLGKNKALLIRANRPAYSNTRQDQEYEAEGILESKVKLLLEKYLLDKKNLDPKFIGEFQALPEGDVLYEKHGTTNLINLRYTTTRYAKNYLFISIANNEEEFLKIISEEDFADNGFVQEDINLPSLSIESTDFITENDFDLSSIPSAYTFDLNDKISENKSM
jgi:hypothetical protein